METEAILASSEWVNAGGILLIMVGISFLILEFFLPSFGLFGFAGIASIVIGVVQLHQTGYIEEMPISVNVLIGIAFIGLTLSAIGGWYTWKLFKKKQTTGVEAMIGETAHIINWKNTSGNVHILGEDWQAYSDHTYTLKKGDTVMVSKIDGLKIKILPIDNKTNT